jgi:hypothetical protein
MARMAFKQQEKNCIKAVWVANTENAFFNF